MILILIIILYKKIKVKKGIFDYSCNDKTSVFNSKNVLYLLELLILTINLIKIKTSVIEYRKDWFFFHLSLSVQTISRHVWCQ